MMIRPRFRVCRAFQWLLVAGFALACLQAEAADKKKKKPPKTVAKSSAQQSLRWKFKAGDELHYTMVQKMDVTMTVAGQKISTPMTQVFDMTWQVQDVQPDGAAAIAQKVDSIVFKMDAPFGKMEYDSKAGKKLEGLMAAMNAPFDALLKAGATMTMSPRGEVSKLEVPEELKKTLAAGGQGLSEDSIKQMSDVGILPDGPVEIGATWNHQADVKMPMVGTMKIDATYTYKGPEDRDGKKLQRIDMAMKMTLEPDPNAQAAPNLKSQEGSGEIYFDNEKGQIAESTTKQKMVLEVKVQNQAIEQAFDQTTTLKPTEAADEQTEKPAEPNKTPSKN